MFTSEEPTRFGMSCLGSRAMARTLTPATLLNVLDDQELNFMQAAAAAGCHPGATPEATIAAVAARAAGIGYFVELHIEQGTPPAHGTAGAMRTHAPPRHFPSGLQVTPFLCACVRDSSWGYMLRAPPVLLQTPVSRVWVSKHTSLGSLKA